MLRRAKALISSRKFIKKLAEDKSLRDYSKTPFVAPRLQKVREMSSMPTKEALLSSAVMGGRKFKTPRVDGAAVNREVKRSVAGQLTTAAAHSEGEDKEIVASPAFEMVNALNELEVKKYKQATFAARQTRQLLDRELLALHNAPRDRLDLSCGPLAEMLKNVDSLPPPTPEVAQFSAQLSELKNLKIMDLVAPLDSAPARPAVYDPVRSVISLQDNKNIEGGYNTHTDAKGEGANHTQDPQKTESVLISQKELRSKTDSSVPMEKLLSFADIVADTRLLRQFEEAPVYTSESLLLSEKQLALATDLSSFQRGLLEAGTETFAPPQKFSRLSRPAQLFYLKHYFRTPAALLSLSATLPVRALSGLEVPIFLRLAEMANEQKGKGDEVADLRMATDWRYRQAVWRALRVLPSVGDSEFAQILGGFAAIHGREEGRLFGADAHVRVRKILLSQLDARLPAMASSPGDLAVVLAALRNIPGARETAEPSRIEALLAAAETAASKLEIETLPPRVTAFSYAELLDFFGYVATEPAAEASAAKAATAGEATLRSLARAGPRAFAAGTARRVLGAGLALWPQMPAGTLASFLGRAEPALKALTPTLPMPAVAALLTSLLVSGKGDSLLFTPLRNRLLDCFESGESMRAVDLLASLTALAGLDMRRRHGRLLLAGFGEGESDIETTSTGPNEENLAALNAPAGGRDFAVVLRSKALFGLPLFARRDGAKQKAFARLLEKAAAKAELAAGEEALLLGETLYLYEALDGPAGDKFLSDLNEDSLDDESLARLAFFAAVSRPLCLGARRLAEASAARLRAPQTPTPLAATAVVDLCLARLALDEPLSPALITRLCGVFTSLDPGAKSALALLFTTRDALTPSSASPLHDLFAEFLSSQETISLPLVERLAVLLSAAQMKVTTLAQIPVEVLHSIERQNLLKDSATPGEFESALAELGREILSVSGVESEEDAVISFGSSYSAYLPLFFDKANSAVLFFNDIRLEKSTGLSLLARQKALETQGINLTLLPLSSLFKRDDKGTKKELAIKIVDDLKMPKLQSN